MKPLNRRTLLRGLGASVALPWLEAFGQATSFPRRLVIFFTGNGTIADQFIPTGTTTNFTLPRILRPLEPFRSKLLVLDGLDNIIRGPGITGHVKAMGTLLTGTEMVLGPSGREEDATVGGPSVDQFIASRLMAGTRFESLEFAAGTTSVGQPIARHMSYKATRQPVLGEKDPVRMFDRLFGAVSGDPVAAQRLITKRTLAFDRVNADFAALRTTVGAEDRARLDAHAQSLVEIERRALATQGVACTRPSRPTVTTDEPALARSLMDLLHRALACDLTRVATFQFGSAQSGGRFPWLGFSDGFHTLSHAGDSDLVAREKLVKINEWYAQQFAYLLGKLDSTQEGDGTLLDNTTVVWVNELSTGNTHLRTNIPIVMAGGMGGKFKMGRFIQLPTTGRQYHNDLLLSLVQGMDVPATTFGNPMYCRGPLSVLAG
jgi:hypothetical protein